MKLLLLGSMLFSGGSAVAMQNEEINTTVNDTVDNVAQYVQKRLGRRIADTVGETGFPYPPETALAQLTEDQVFAITSEIDQINAEYDWANMTDEEIAVALQEVHARLDALYTDLGIELPQNQNQNQYRGANGKNRAGNRKGNVGHNDGNCPYEDDTSETAPDVA